MSGDLRPKIEAQRNWLEQLLATVPGFKGYLERETRREADALQREALAGRLARVKQSLENAVLAITESKRIDLLGDLDRVRKRIELAIGKIRFASHGYSGFFDAVKVDASCLDRVCEFDIALHRQIETIEKKLACLHDVSDSAKVRQCCKETLDKLSELDRLMEQREQILRGIS